MNALILLTKGFEEIEAITVIDVLRRAGIEVTVAGIKDNVEGAHKIKIIPDKTFSNAFKDTDCYDAVILPGGPGHKDLMTNDEVIKLIKEFNNKNKIVAAICASPAVLGRAGVLEGRKATIYPGMEQAIPKAVDERVVMDNNIITSKGPGTAMIFALKLVEELVGESMAEKLKQEMIV